MRYPLLISFLLTLLPSLCSAFALASDPAARVAKVRTPQATPHPAPMPIRHAGGMGHGSKTWSRGRPETDNDRLATDNKRRRTFHAR